MMDRRKRARLKRVLGSMRLNFIAFAALIVIAVIVVAFWVVKRVLPAVREGRGSSEGTRDGE